MSAEINNDNDTVNPTGYKNMHIFKFK